MREFQRAPPTVEEWGLERLQGLWCLYDRPDARAEAVWKSKPLVSFSLSLDPLFPPPPDGIPSGHPSAHLPRFCRSALGEQPRPPPGGQSLLLQPTLFSSPMRFSFCSFFLLLLLSPPKPGHSPLKRQGPF